QADLLRRAMGKKIKAEMDIHRERFIEGAGRKGILTSVAEQIFEQAAKFAGYGFNKGHAAAYAQVAYQTAYLKANFPVEFLAASMTLDIGNTDRLNIFRQEAQRLGIKVLPPDLNRSDAAFACDAEKGVIYYALAAVKGVGYQAMESIVAERQAGGPFRSSGDFSRRVDPRHVNKRAFESLARAGAFDRLNPNRRQMVESSDILLGSAQRNAREREMGQTALFGDASDKSDDIRLAQVADWPMHERLSEEFSAMGFYLSGHPLDAYAAALKRLGAVNYAALLEDRRRSGFKAVLAGTMIKKHERRSRNDQSYAFVSFSDPSGMFEVMLFPEVLAASRPLLEAGKSVLVTCSAEWDGDDLKLRAASISDLDRAAEQAGEGLRIHIENEDALGPIAANLKQQGKGIVTVVVPGARGEEVEIQLPKRHLVSAAVKNAIKTMPGVTMVESV
ncbi:MAG: DNA polymerase III subunit alpha, partial [Alphaproteobacteria bacterium]|nr:DNA polymerase III subunit alpha [Alphaproteobacteria bacterium]